MNCAWVSITGSPQASPQQWYQLPNIFVADLWGINNCSIPEGTDYVPPQPGPEIEYGGDYVTASPSPWPTNCEEPTNVIYTGPVSVSTDPPMTSTMLGSDPAMADMDMVMAAAVSSTDTTSAAISYTTIWVDELCSELLPLTTTITASTITVPYPTTLSTQMSSSAAAASFTVPMPPYATGNIDIYEPCVPGTFLCTDANDFLTCDQPSTSSNSVSQSSGWSWQDSRAVADGMTCLPFLSPLSSATVSYGQMPGAPQGFFRDDRYVRARPDGSCDVDGALQCNGSSDFWICDQGGWVDMGSVAEGTVCQSNEIVAAS